MCSGCRGSSQSNPRIRYTPTFFHHPIFGDFDRGCYQNPKCNKNSQSNIPNRNCHQQPRNCQSRLQTNLRQERGRQCCKDKQIKRREQIYQNNNNQDSLEQINTQTKFRPSSSKKQVKFQKQISFNPHASNQFHNAGSHSALSNHTKLWYNPQKQILLRECSNCHHHGLPRQRKLLQMSSCPFYPENDYAHMIQGSKCGCGQNIKQQTGKYQGEQKNSKYILTATKKLNTCNNCQDSCPCTNQCFCNNNCVCCAKKQFYQQYKKQQKNCKCNSKCICGPDCTCGPNCSCCKNYQSEGCRCQNGCKCAYDCSCGTNCKCCPKFLPYGQCICDERCICGPNCKCQSACRCCPKNKKQICPKQSYKNYQVQSKFCNCGPQCGCGPQCRCGPQCKCGQIKKRAQNIVQRQQNGKATKTTIPNGTKKTKSQQNNIRKSQPVFKSVTGRRG